MKPWMVLGLAAALAACASTPPPLGDAPIDWASVGAERVPVIVTMDPDGDERVTKLWLVVVDGEGIISTGNSRWFRNIERDPNVEFRIGGHAYPLRAELITDESLRQRAKEAFREKYGWEDSVVRFFERGEPNIMRLIPRE
jgi:hypothetical protein